MQTVFRVKRHWDAKQLTGLKLAKRRRLEGDVPVILTYAGTAPNNVSNNVPFEEVDVANSISHCFRILRLQIIRQTVRTVTSDAHGDY